MRRGIPTLIALLVVVVGMALFAWYFGREDVSANHAATMADRPVPAAGWGPIRVMTVNVRLDEPQDGANGWLNRRESLVRTLLRHMPDVLGCQELSPAQGAYVKRELATWYAYYPRAGVGTGRAPASGAADIGTANGGTTTGTASLGGELLGALSDSLAALNTVFYRTDRFEILDGESGLVLPNELQANATENTFFSLAVLKERRDGRRKESNAGTVIVVDVHFRHNETFALKCAGRLKERIAAWLARYPRSGVVMMGDMNHDRTSRLYATLASAETLSLTDLFDYKKMGTGKNGTYHAFTGVPQGAWPIDFIWCGGVFKISGNAAVLKDRSEEGRWPTDHFPVEATVGW